MAVLVPGQRPAGRGPVRGQEGELRGAYREQAEPLSLCDGTSSCISGKKQRRSTASIASIARRLDKSPARTILSTISLFDLQSVIDAPLAMFTNKSSEVDNHLFLDSFELMRNVRVHR